MSDKRKYMPFHLLVFNLNLFPIKMRLIWGTRPGTIDKNLEQEINLTSISTFYVGPESCLNIDKRDFTNISQKAFFLK